MKVTDKEKTYKQGLRTSDKKRSKLDLPFSKYLFYLVLATSLISAVSLSRYSTTGQSSHFARTAIFDVEITHHNDPWNIDEYKDITMLEGDQVRTIYFQIKNKGEVAVRVRAINADNDSVFGQEQYILTDMNDQIVTLDTGNWFTLSPSGGDHDTRYIEASIGSLGAINTVKFYFEYEQID